MWVHNTQKAIKIKFLGLSEPFFIQLFNLTLYYCCPDFSSGRCSPSLAHLCQNHHPSTPNCIVTAAPWETSAKQFSFKKPSAPLKSSQPCFKLSWVKECGPHSYPSISEREITSGWGAHNKLWEQELVNLAHLWSAKWVWLQQMILFQWHISCQKHRAAVQLLKIPIFLTQLESHPCTL